MSPNLPPVDVIVPVYRNLAATRRCVESVLAGEPGPRARLIVIDDASPEPGVADYCTQLRERPDVLLLRNEENLGFVATVNRGMQSSGTHDVVLLNSDTEVANDWLSRLQACAHSRPQVATVTPLSNNASVCSYPLPLRENPLPQGWTVGQLDELAARANRGTSIEMPTAVGFCMYIRRDCLAEIGLFDEENFGAGYGEECDFSMRARQAGWANLLCPDVFVYHEGSQSFRDTAGERISAAEQTLQRLHPQYHVEATRFIDADPVRPFRDALDTARLHRDAAEAMPVIDALRTYRDQLVSGKTNRELGLEHALGEVTQQKAELASQLKASAAALADCRAELQLLQARDHRWRPLLYLVNRLDALFGQRS
jgi:GT2 family glycosyltransferase